jgi:cytoskeletal protein CcmA (bactofilin family)
LAILSLLIILSVAFQGPKSTFNWVITKMLTVQNGGATFTGDLNLGTNDITAGDADLSGTLDVDGATTLNSTLDVDGNLTSGTGSITMADTVNVTGAADFDSTLNVDGNVSSATGAFTVADTINVTGAADLDSTLNVDGNVTLGGNITNRAIAIRLQDVANDDTDNVLSATGVASATATVAAGITNPDYPRNVVVTYQSVTTSTAGTFTITGVDTRGNSTTDALATGAVSGTQTLTGLVAWSSITTFTMPTTRTEAITLSVGLGEKFGLPIIPVAAADVFFVAENNAYVSAYTVNTTYGTLLPTPDVVANDDFTIWMKQ